MKTLLFTAILLSGVAAQDCWQTPEGVEADIAAFYDLGDAWTRPADPICKEPTPNTDPGCAAFREERWGKCKAIALKQFHTDLQAAYDNYFGAPEYVAAVDAYETSLVAALEICPDQACYEALANAAKATFCSAWSDEKEEAYDADISTAITTFIMLMTMCDDTFSETDCCIGDW
jgi:hypothetical protein